LCDRLRAHGIGQVPSVVGSQPASYSNILS
jgi:hypothetical protein